MDLERDNYYKPCVVFYDVDDEVQILGNAKSFERYFHGDIKPSNIVVTDAKYDNLAES